MDYVNSIIHTKDNSILVCGNSISGATGDKTGVNRGSFDYLVVKYDLNYNEIWQKTIGGDDYDNLFDAIELSDGAYLLGGLSYSGISGDKTNERIGNYDYWVIKLSQTGDILWQNVYGGNGSSGMNSMIELNDGSIVLCGTSNADASGTKTEDSKGGKDYWIIKIDANGNQIWDKTIGSSAYDYYPDIIIDNQDNLYIVGYTTGNVSGDKTENNYDNSQDVWIVKINIDGNIIWDKTIGSNEIEYSVKALYLHNNIYLAIASDGDVGGLKTEPNYNSTNGYTDTWLVKLDLDGNIIWDKTIGGTASDGPSDISPLDDTHILIANGSSSNMSGDKTEGNMGLSDNWLVKIDTSGNVIWDKTIGGFQDDNSPKIAIVDNTTLVIGGYSKSGIGGDKTNYCRGEEDLWIYTLDISEDISEYIINTDGFSIFPNPAGDFIQIESKSLIGEEINIYNMTGQEVFSNSKLTFNMRINISNFNKGIYLVKIGEQSKKIVKE